MRDVAELLWLTQWLLDKREDPLWRRSALTRSFRAFPGDLTSFQAIEHQTVDSSLRHAACQLCQD
jgi:hypothetical protein